MTIRGVEALFIFIFLNAGRCESGSFQQGIKKLCGNRIPGFCNQLSNIFETEDTQQKIVSDEQPSPEDENVVDLQPEEVIQYNGRSGYLEEQSPAVQVTTFEASPVYQLLSIDYSYLSSPSVVQYYQQQQNPYESSDNNFVYSYNTEQQCADKSVCQLPTETGFCRLGLWQYSFDQSTNDCKGFVYGGCLGNENRFDSYEECQNCCQQ